jgi:beta-xylosidase
MMKTSLYAVAAAISSIAFASDVPAPYAISNTTNATYTNPILWEDLADIDIFRVGDEYYYSASTMAFSPGAPILKSGDLVNWEYIGHSVPRLEFNDPEAYSLENGKQAYVRGIWASSMRYRESDDTWYWIGCIGFNKTYIYTAADPTDEWSLASTIDTCYYDCGLLFDDNDDIYVAYGNTNLSVARLNNDLTEKDTTPVFNATFYLEGSRMYQINGTYYILLTQPADWEWILKSSDGPFGPYELEIFANRTAPPSPKGGYPHQGGIVDTPEGDWYYLAFMDAYPGGRVPVLSPFTWNATGWPKLPSNNSFAVPNTYPVPPVPVSPYNRSQFFEGPSLGPQWEWNHNPDTSAFSFASNSSSGGGLILDTASVTHDLFHAKNTLTHRIPGPASAATLHLSIPSMSPGDRAGLALFRDNTAFIAVEDGTVSVWKNLSLGAGWETLSTGFVEANASLPANSTDVWFRLEANIAPASDHLGTFSWSADGEEYEVLGTPYEMNATYFFFIGYRFGIFNYATEELGGSVTVKSFEIEDV